MTWTALVAPVASSVCATLLAAPLLRRLLLRHDLVDVPNHRSSHAVVTPRGGGIACAFGLLVGVAVWAATEGSVPWSVLAGALGLALVGFVDDRWTLPARPRLLAQLLTGAAVGWVTGGPWLAALGVVLVAFLVNVVNFVDGINGITGLTIAVWGASTAILGLAQDVEALAVLGAIAAGAATGFLPWNVPRAKLFLGDVGSYLLGGLVALSSLVAVAADISLVVVLAPLALSMADVVRTLVVRWRRGAKLTEAHREHVYQLLVSEAGLSHLAVSLIVAVGGATLAAAWHAASPVVATTVTVLVVLAYVAAPSVLRKEPALSVSSTHEVEPAERA